MKKSLEEVDLMKEDKKTRFSEAGFFLLRL